VLMSGYAEVFLYSTGWPRNYACFKLIGQLRLWFFTLD